VQPLSPGGAESTCASTGFCQVCLGPFDSFVLGYDQLRDAVSGANLIDIFAEVQQDHANLASIAGVDGAGTVQDSDGVFERKSAAGPNLSLIARRDFDGEAGADGDGRAWLEQSRLHGVQIHACIFQRAVCVLRQAGLGRELPDIDLQRAIIASSCRVMWSLV
jgi:hypothetical protein